MNIPVSVSEEVDKLQDTKYPILIIVRGVPGSGKSYLAAALQELMEKERVVIVDPDATDYSSEEYLEHSKALTAEGIDKKFHPYRFVRAKAHKAITDHKVLIWAQAFTNLDGFNKTVVNLQTYASDHDTWLPLLVVEVEANEATAKERAAKREEQTGRSVSEEMFARFINDYVSFADQGYRIVTVHGEDDVSVSASSVLKALKEL